jgi:hypothetical protein
MGVLASRFAHADPSLGPPCQIDKMCPKLYSKFRMWWPIDLRTLWHFCFLISYFSTPLKVGSVPPPTQKKSGISKFSEIFVVGTLHFYLKTPGTMQKKWGQSDHPVRRKGIKRAKILAYFVIDLKRQNLTTIWTFSQGWVIGLSSLLLHCANCLYTQVYTKIYLTDHKEIVHTPLQICFICFHNLQNAILV